MGAGRAGTCMCNCVDKSYLKPEPEGKQGHLCKGVGGAGDKVMRTRAARPELGAKQRMRVQSRGAELGGASSECLSRLGAPAPHRSWTSLPSPDFAPALASQHWLSLKSPGQLYECPCLPPPPWLQVCLVPVEAQALCVCVRPPGDSRTGFVSKHKK